MNTQKQRRRKKIILVLVSCFVFGIGYYFLNEVSTWFEVPLGVTFHVIFGCCLMAISGIYIGYTLNQLFFTKKRKRTKRIYLDSTTDEKSTK
jgi:hypothetical protein